MGWGVCVTAPRLTAAVAATALAVHEVLVFLDPMLEFGVRFSFWIMLPKALLKIIIKKDLTQTLAIGINAQICIILSLK